MSYIITEQIEALYAHIEAANTIIIHRHLRPDPDAFGSQLGLKYLIEHHFPNKRVLAAGTMTAGLKWLGNMDKVTQEDYENALVIVCDTANQPRIDGDLYSHGHSLIKIDHHPVVDDYGDVQIVHTQASSCSEIIIEISRYLGVRLPMTAQAARMLYAGVVGDTGRFLFRSTTALTFESTAFLKQFDFDAYEVNDRLRTITVNEAKFHGYVYENLQVNEVGVAHLIVTRETMEHFGVTEEQTNSAVGLPGNIHGILTWAVFVEQEGKSTHYRCRLRSKGPVINEIAANHHGGGHPMASGADAYSEEEIQAIITELTQAAIKYEKENS